MKIRCAMVTDARAICDVVNYHAERGKMLHVSLEHVYGSIRAFSVAADDRERVMGCVAVIVYWADLAEVRSLAVAPDHIGQGVGGALLESAKDEALRLGIRRLFTLTGEQEFFRKRRFDVIDRQQLPEKVWRACVACPKSDACDEIAMICRLDAPVA